MQVSAKPLAFRSAADASSAPAVLKLTTTGPARMAAALLHSDISTLMMREY